MAIAIAILIKMAGAEVGSAIIAATVAVSGAIAGSEAAAAAMDVTGTIAVTEIIAVTIAGAGAGALFILVRSGPIYHTRYSRVAATIAVASILAFMSSIANYLNKGVPLDETFSEISGSYWKKACELVHTPIDYLWTVFYDQ